MATYYLNNDGSRWVERPGAPVRLIIGALHYNKMRKPAFFESVGNFAACHFDVGFEGKRYHVAGFADSFRNERGEVVVHIERVKASR